MIRPQSLASREAARAGLSFKRQGSNCENADPKQAQSTCLKTINCIRPQIEDTTNWDTNDSLSINLVRKSSPTSDLPQQGPNQLTSLMAATREESFLQQFNEEKEGEGRVTGRGCVPPWNNLNRPLT